MTLSLPLIVALLIMAWLTAGSMAVRSVSRIWLRHWAERQLRGSAAAVAYLERPHRLLTGASVGTSLTLLLAGMGVGLAGNGVAVMWAALIFGGVIVLAGQLFPRAIARRWPAAVAPVVLPVLRVVNVITLPIVNAGEAIAHVFLRETRPAPDVTDRDAIQDLFKDNGWKSFYKSYPQSGGYVIMSAVGFNREKTRAIVYTGSSCGALCGSWRFHLLEKINGNWKEVPGVNCSMVS